MVVAVLNALAHLGFLLGLGLLDSLVVLQRARFDLFFPVGVWRVYILLRVGCQ